MGNPRDANLAILAEKNPALYEKVRDHRNEPIPETLPAAGTQHPPIRLSEHRCTTIVYLGIDDNLTPLLDGLNGENNLLVVEPDISKFSRLLDASISPKFADPTAVQWIFDTACFEGGALDHFFLGRTRILATGESSRSLLALDALKYVKKRALEVDQRRRTSSHPYLVMVTYNRLDFTRITLERLLKNTTLPFRLVILDNGSTDGTQDWLKANREGFPFIDKLFFFEENLGIGRALNNGMSYALSQSQRVGRIDNDVLVPPRWLEDLTAVLESDLNPMVVAGCITDDDVAKAQIRNSVPQHVAGLKVYAVDYAGGFLNLYRSDVFDQLGFFPEYPLYGVEDGGLCKAAKGQGERVLVVDNVKVEHLPSFLGEALDYEDFKHRQLGLHPHHRPSPPDRH
ncbi:MAG: glycosyltransferase family 2 protein [Myxococcota bacterium]|nr:glycosyltransferase family 2 protein [Myxococcota bacterium]